MPPTPSPLVPCLLSLPTAYILRSHSGGWAFGSTSYSSKSREIAPSCCADAEQVCPLSALPQQQSGKWPLATQEASLVGGAPGPWGDRREGEKEVVFISHSHKLASLARRGEQPMPKSLGLAPPCSSSRTVFCSTHSHSNGPRHLMRA